jgi:hypothetical protein
MERNNCVNPVQYRLKRRYGFTKLFLNYWRIFVKNRYISAVEVEPIVQNHTLPKLQGNLTIPTFFCNTGIRLPVSGHSGTCTEYRK